MPVLLGTDSQVISTLGKFEPWSINVVYVALYNGIHIIDRHCGFVGLCEAPCVATTDNFVICKGMPLVVRLCL